MSPPERRGVCAENLADSDMASEKANMVQSLSNAMMRLLKVFSACCLTGYCHQ
jgi:hypothetical protein